MLTIGLMSMSWGAKMDNSGTLKAMPRPEAIKQAKELRKQGYKARIQMIATGYIVNYWIQNNS